MTARTIGEDQRRAAAAEPDKLAVIAPEGELSYADLDRAADRLAAGLAHNGVQRGDRVATLLPNSLEAAVSARLERLGGFRAPGTPARLNKVGVLEIGPRSARNVLVLSPGTSAGAAYSRRSASRSCSGRRAGRCGRSSGARTCSRIIGC